MNTVIIRGSRRAATALATVVALLLVLATMAFAVDSRTCPDPLGTKVEVTGEKPSITVTALAGQLIASYCVKAGSEKQGYGTTVVVLDPPQASVTIVHPSGKGISHYVLSLVPVGTPTTTTTGGPSSTTTSTVTNPPTTTDTTTSSTTSPATTTSSSSTTATATPSTSTASSPSTTSSTPVKMTPTGKVVRPTRVATTTEATVAVPQPSTSSSTYSPPDVLAETGVGSALAFIAILGLILLGIGVAASHASRRNH